MIKVVAAVLVKDNKIILARRSNNLKNFPNLFEFPGGKIENNETPKEALKRELLEELNIHVNVHDIYPFYGNSSQHTIESSGKIIDLTLFIIKKWKGTLQPKINIHSELAYIDIEKNNIIDKMIPGDAEFLPAIKLAL